MSEALRDFMMDAFCCKDLNIVRDDAAGLKPSFSRSHLKLSPPRNRWKSYTTSSAPTLPIRQITPNSPTPTSTARSPRGYQEAGLTRAMSSRSSPRRAPPVLKIERQPIESLSPIQKLSVWASTA
ncbi:expressed unknown protein [Seminavis robusta]|uniref:Uncharacterized protein n=1 Tax=Seminavis robusta TaxID=568900 RepID=A0A9N8HD87_9STRA|nr:expressed unknown protein [Seminavis robusta]|eukprot:Sro249_g098850.1 n/a (125) ;mRNA; f:83481-83855